MFTHTHADESVEPVLDVEDRSMEQTSHDSKPDEALNEPTSHGWHVSVDESKNRPGPHTHDPSTDTRLPGQMQSFGDELSQEDMEPDSTDSQLVAVVESQKEPNVHSEHANTSSSVL